jgi:hypothetical protein
MSDDELKAALRAAFKEAIEKIGIDAFRSTSWFLAGRRNLATQVAEAA